MFGKRYCMNSYPELKFRNKIQYSRDFPILFDLGDLTKIEENITFSILGELTDRYSLDNIEFTYSEIARMAGLVSVDSAQREFAQTGERFNKIIESLQNKLQTVSYKKLKSINTNGEIDDYEVYPLFKKYRVSHREQKLTVVLSDEVYQEEFIEIDSEGNSIIHPEKRVYELFNQENWSQVKYLKFGREIHNLLKSKYSKRLYRFISEYRNYGSCYKLAEEFEIDTMKLNTPALKRNKKQKIQDAFDELKNLKDQEGNAIIPNFEMKVERRGRSTYKYYFSFSKFSNDLNEVIEQHNNSLVLKLSPLKKIDEDIDKEDYQSILEVFQDVFGTDRKVDNNSNRKRIREWMNLMDANVIKEIMIRTSYKTGRSFGWTVNTMQNLIDSNVVTLDDLKEYEDNTYKKESVIINQLIREKPEYEPLFDNLKVMIKQKISILILNDIEKYAEKVEVGVINQAIKVAIFNNKNKWTYVKGILENWIKLGIVTVDKINAIEEEKHKPVIVSDDFLEAMDLWSD